MFAAQVGHCVLLRDRLMTKFRLTSLRPGAFAAGVFAFGRRGSAMSNGSEQRPWMSSRDKKRFWSKVSIAARSRSICWPWTGYKRGDYGYFKLGGKMRSAHRVAYEDLIGPIPAGLVVDHLCRNPICVNPFHLEPVTHQVNNRRGLGPKVASERMKRRNQRRIQCKHGHPFTPENTYVQPDGRRCRQCIARRMREWRARKMSKPSL
jgi:hypothetical protein